MHKHILFVCLFFLVTFNAFSQEDFEEEAADTVSTTLPITIRKGLFTSFYQNNEKLSTSLLQEVVVKSPEAVSEMKRARRNYLTAVALNTLGSFMVAYPVASSVLSGSKINWKLTGLGAGMLVVGIPLSKIATKHAVNAAEIHNRRVGKPTGYRNNLKLNFAPTGAGLSWTF